MPSPHSNSTTNAKGNAIGFRVFLSVIGLNLGAGGYLALTGQIGRPALQHILAVLFLGGALLFILTAVFGSRLFVLKLVAFVVEADPDAVEREEAVPPSPTTPSRLLIPVFMIFFLIGLIYFAMALWHWEHFLASILCWAAAPVLGLSFMLWWNFSSTSRFVKRLELVLPAAGYSVADKAQRNMARQFLKHSFLKDDMLFDVKKCWWIPVEGDLLLWGQYVTLGTSMGAGIFCAVQSEQSGFAHSMKQLLAKLGPTFDDEKVKTTYGRFSDVGATPFVGLERFQWQMLATVLVCQFDETAVKTRRPTTARHEVVDEDVDDAVTAFEVLCAVAHGETNATTEGLPL